jgi:hypothetical protein
MWGCYYPSDSFSYTNKVSIRGLVYILLSFPLFAKFPSALSASFLFFTGVVCLYGVHRGEAGDNGRAARAKRKAQAAARGGGGNKGGNKPQGRGGEAGSWSPIKYYRKLVDENKLAIYVWVFLYFFSNALTFFYTLSIWVGSVKTMEQGLLDGTLDTLCDDDTCALNKVIVTKGGISSWGPYAKACGMCLNFNCSLIVYPVVKILLRRLNNIGVSFNNNKTANPTVFAKFFAKPVTRLIPLSKNIDFHKLIAKVRGRSEMTRLDANPYPGNQQQLTGRLRFPYRRLWGPLRPATQSSTSSTIGLRARRRSPSSRSGAGGARPSSQAP